MGPPGIFAGVSRGVAAADERASALAGHVAHDVDGVAEVAVQLGHAVPIPRMLPHPASAVFSALSQVRVALQCAFYTVANVARGLY